MSFVSAVTLSQLSINYPTLYSRRWTFSLLLSDFNFKMLLKNSALLLTALTAGSAAARLHGHERRHVHHARNQDVDKRGVGDMVYATINGKLVSWVNEWSGEPNTAPAPAPTNTAPTQTTVPHATIATVEATGTTIPGDNSGAGSGWFSVPENGEFSREGFGEKSLQRGGDRIFYKGNVGNPWGSNIIEVAPEKAHQYKHVVRIASSNKDPWTIVFWNKIGPDGKLTGWYGNAALKFTLHPDEVKYVAFDDDTQGAWGAAKGDNLPVDEFGGYSCTWGEFDFGNTSNNGWSGWDVSAIQAQAAGVDIQGMKICDHNGDKCSSISGSATSVINAYTFDLRWEDGIGGSAISGPVRLDVEVDWQG